MKRPRTRLEKDLLRELRHDDDVIAHLVALAELHDARRCSTCWKARIVAERGRVAPGA